MAKRMIIEIDRDKCDGCGLCTTACAEGALVLDQENKAVLLKEIYCDGMGACLDVCPTGALEIIDRESEAYNAPVAYEHVLSTRGSEAAARVHGVAASPPPDLGSHPAAARSHLSACPGSTPVEIPKENSATAKQKAISGASELRQWPIQFQLVSSYAPYFKSTDLLLAADCTAFALGSFHHDLLKGKKLIIACSKLDDTDGYVEKLAEIIKQNALKSLTVAIMTVPCCSGLYRIAEEALALSRVHLNLKTIVIPIDGKIPQ